MNEPTHSPEPWADGTVGWGEVIIVDADGATVCASSERHARLHLDDAERIVACVNALAGVPTADLTADRPPRHVELGLALARSNGDPESVASALALILDETPDWFDSLLPAYVRNLRTELVRLRIRVNAASAEKA